MKIPIQIPDGQLDDYRFLINEIFIQQIYRVNLTNPDPLIIDVGANIGISTLYFCKKHPNAKILAFEASKKCFPWLTNNTKKYQNISCFNVALGEGEYVYFYEPKNRIGFGSSIFRSRVGNEYKKSKVRTDRLSNYLNGNVDLLKIDIEGSEFFVIEDLYDNHKLSLVQIVVMEFHNNVSDKNKLSHILKMFEDSGFKYQFSRPSHIKYEEERQRDLYYDGYQTMILKAWNLGDPENRKFDL